MNIFKFVRFKIVNQSQVFKDSQEAATGLSLDIMIFEGGRVKRSVR